LNLREIVQLVALIGVACWIGLYPRPFLRLSESASQPVLERVHSSMTLNLTSPGTPTPLAYSGHSGPGHQANGVAP